MQEPFTAAASEAVALLTRALTDGHSVTLSLATPPHVIRQPPLVVACCLKLQMTPSEARVTVALMDHGYVGREDLHVAMSRGSRGPSKVKTVDVVVCRARQKLAGHGIAIETVWRSGYKKINEDDRDRLRQLLADHGAGNAGAAADGDRPREGGDRGQAPALREALRADVKSDGRPSAAHADHKTG